jgi:hypothetical protein
MALRSPVLYHNFWGSFADNTALPNKAAAPLPTSRFFLEAGDFAYVADEQTFYICTDAGGANATPAATWIALSTGGGSALDRFAPKHLVGFAPSGDPGTDFSANGFYYWADDGSGNGIRAALLAAASNVPGDVWIRPGTYNLTPEDPALVIPPKTRVQGAGETTRIQKQVIGDGSVLTIFTMQDGSELRDVYLEQTLVDAAEYAFDGAGVVEVVSYTVDETIVFPSVHVERISVNVNDELLFARGVAAVFVGSGCSAEADRCAVVLRGTGRTEQPVVPPPINPVEPPAPTGTTYTVGTLGAENFPDLATALASGSVVNGDLLLLSAQTFTVAATITVATQVTIQGAGIGLTILQTANTPTDPTPVLQINASNVTVRDLTVKQRKSVADSIAAAIAINPLNGGVGSTGHFIEAVRVETMEFGIVVRSDGWQINNCQLAYVGPSNGTRRLVATYRSNGQGLFCNSTFDSGQAPPVDTGTSTGANTATTLNDTSKSWTVNQFVGLTLTITGGLGATQARTITANTATQLSVTPAWTTTPDATSTYSISVVGGTTVFAILGSAPQPNETTSGYLRLGNITPSNAYPVFQFLNCEYFPTNPSPFTLYVDNCVTDETSAFVVWFNSVPNLLNRFQSITFANNTLSGNHGGAPVGCKGMFAVDSSGTPAQPWGTTTFYASGNTIGNTTFRTGWQTIMSTAAPPGYGPAALALAGWDGTFFVSNPALEFPMAIVPADPANAITGWRMGGKSLRLDVCFCTGGDASVLAGGAVVEGAASLVDIDQCVFEDFGLLGIGCQDCDLAVTGGTRIASLRDENQDLWGIICRQTVEQAPAPSTALINARITLPLASEATSVVGIDLEVDSGQITASRIEAESGIVSGNATGRGVAIGFNSVISQPGQQISAQLVDEVAHNILST